jgi:hypothetical protein
VSFADLAVQKEKAGNSDQGIDTIMPATKTIGKLTKRSNELRDEEHGLEKRRKLFQEPLWHCVPNFWPRHGGLDNRFVTVSEKVVLVMGRSTLGSLRKNIIDMIDGKLQANVDLLSTSTVILVHGPMGSGKSHIVLLLLWDLTEEFASRPRPLSMGKRVRFIPILDRKTVINDFFRVLIASFMWAFADDEESIRKLKAISDSKDLQIFASNSQDKLVFVLDQWQALENNSEAKSRLLRIIPWSSYQIRVTSAGGEELQREVLSNHSKAFKHTLSGGIKEVSSRHLQVCVSFCCN